MQTYLIITQHPSIEKLQSINPTLSSTHNIDLYTIDLELLNIGIDQVREIKSFLITPPVKSSYKIVFVPHSQRLTDQAQNAFLKTLEEPPDYAFIILTVSNPDDLLPTIISRCQLIHQLNNSPESTMDINKATDLLQSILAANPGKRLTLAEKHGKTRDKAKETFSKFLHYFHHQLHKQPTNQTLKNLSLTQKSLTLINANTNPQLTTEHLFLMLE